MVDSEIIREPLIKPGVLRVKTKDSFTENASISPEEADEYTRTVNQPDEIKKRFVDAPSLFVKDLESKARVITQVPSGQYSPGAMQVIAIRSEIMKAEPVEMVDGRMKTLSIFDFSHDAQNEYFRQIIANMNAMEEEYRDYAQSDFTVLFTENAAATVSTLKHRVARTISEPHSQQWIVNGFIQPFDQNWKVPRLLEKERQVIQLINTKIIEGLESLAPQLTHVNTKLNLRHASPFGYSIQLPVYKKMNVYHQANLLTETLRTHHHMYSEVAKNMLHELNKSNHSYFKKIMTPQPSYKLFGLYNSEDRMDISVAPTLFAPTGVVEALDIVLSRRQDNPALFESQNQEDFYYYAIKQKLEQTN